MKKSVAGDFRMMLQNQIKEPLIRRRKDHGKTVHTFGLIFAFICLNNWRVWNINKKTAPKNAELVLSCNNGGFPKERITKRYERERIKIEKLFTLGYTTSGDPWKIGTK